MKTILVLLCLLAASCGDDDPQSMNMPDNWSGCFPANGWTTCETPERRLAAITGQLTCIVACDRAPLVGAWTSVDGRKLFLYSDGAYATSSGQHGTWVSYESQ